MTFSLQFYPDQGTNTEIEGTAKEYLLDSTYLHDWTVLFIMQADDSLMIKYEPRILEARTILLTEHKATAKALPWDPATLVKLRQFHVAENRALIEHYDVDTHELQMTIRDFRDKSTFVLAYLDSVYEEHEIAGDKHDYVLASFSYKRTDCLIVMTENVVLLKSTPKLFEATHIQTGKEIVPWNPAMLQSMRLDLLRARKHIVEIYDEWAKTVTIEGR